MNFEKHISQMKEIQNHLLSFITNENDSEDDFKELTTIIKDQNILEKREDFYEFLSLLLIISEYHYRNPEFFDRLERIFTYYKTDIITHFTSHELNDIFKKDKRLLLFLIKNSFITVDQTVSTFILDHVFFYPEIKEVIHQGERECILQSIEKAGDDLLDHYDEKRLLGENDSFLCQLIREDKAEEFIQYFNKNNISINANISDSIFETNVYLTENKEDVSLIDYAAFFGSIQIFQYLRLNGIKMKPSLWFYAIHGMNPEIIHLLEEDKIRPENGTFTDCLKMAIKCHHNDIANYIRDNLLDGNQIDKMMVSIGAEFHNYEYFPVSIDKNFITLCFKYDYSKIVDLLIKDAVIDMDYQIECASNDSIEMKIFPFTFFKIPTQPKVYINDYAFSSCSKLTQLTIPSSVTSIGDYAFEKCDNLVEITVPSSVVWIGKGAFQLCSSLKEIKIPSSVTKLNDKTFKYCFKLAHVELPPELTSIGDSCFAHCSLISDFPIISSVEFIGEDCFSDCTSLKKFAVPPSVKCISSYTFAKCSSLTEVSIPSSVTSIGEGSFYSCEKLESIQIPDSVTEIECESFRDCFSLKKVTISSSIKKISNNVFRGCGALKTINIPSSVTLIGLCSFYECHSIEMVELPSSLESIGNYAFAHCKKLSNINFPSSVKIIGNDVFKCCPKLKKLDIPPTVQLINGGFDGNSIPCEKVSVSKLLKGVYTGQSLLVDIEILPSVKSIGKWSFYGCSSLKFVKFHCNSSLVKIGKFAFYSCVSIESISIPSSVVSIKEGAFEECLALKELGFQSPSSLKLIDIFAFKGCASLPFDGVQIPAGVKCGNHAFDGCAKDLKVQNEEEKKCSIF